MILRRVVEHMKRQHWAGAFTELVIVVLGVFIGLQADNWNDARKQRQEESEPIGERRSNLALAIDIKSAWIKAREKKNRDLADGIAVVQELSDSPSISADECAALWQSHIILTSSDNATLIALLSPMRLAIVHDPKLRSALLAYGSQHERAVYAIRRLEDDVVDVVDNYADAFPRRLDVHGLDLHHGRGSDVACQLEKMRASQTLAEQAVEQSGTQHGHRRDSRRGPRAARAPEGRSGRLPPMIPSDAVLATLMAKRGPRCHC